MIKITSMRDGFWRCGVQHSKAPGTYPEDRFTEEELAQLKEEPMLLVEVMEDDDTGDVIAETLAPEEMTVAQLRDLLDRLEVPYDSKALKADLIGLVIQHTAEAQEA